ncbi:MAG TPA: 2-phospho-L-lactate guanylyltransferase [Caulobacteraceae bacterium]|nr:2-phospho-L-lactate guanylyltransferase [Caulobacteraceae bacterium]
MISLVVAARGGPRSKSRCADALDGVQRTALTEAMLRDMLAAAGRAPGVSEVVVVTPTEALAHLAATAGARVIRQGRRGLNAAFNQALDELAGQTPDGTVALLPGDLPLLDPDDLSRAVALAATHDVVLTPALDRGTGAILIRPQARFALAFGQSSFTRHERAARQRGLSVAVFACDSLGLDVDTPDDLHAVLRRGPATYTADFLRQVLAPEPPAVCAAE